MAFGAPVSRGTAAIRNSSGTTSIVAVNANIVVGRLVLVRAGFDNQTTSDGETNQLSCADASGNTWVKVKEWTETSGAARDGTVHALFLSVITTQIDSGANITVTSTAATLARVTAVDEVTIGASAVAFITPVQAAGGAGNSDTTDLTYSGLASREYLLIGSGSQERSSSGYTVDSDYTALTESSSAGGAVDSNQTTKGGYRIATLTGDTYSVTWTQAGEWAHILAAIYEEAGGPIVAATGVAVETDAGLASTVVKTQELTTGLAAEADVALASATARQVASGVAEEVDASLPSTIVKTQILQTGVAQETDAALESAVVKTQLLATGLPVEADEALESTAGTTGGPIIAQTGVAQEADTVLPSAVVKTQRVVTGLAVELDAAIASKAAHVVATGLAEELEAALAAAVVKTQRLSTGVALEADVALAGNAFSDTGGVVVTGVAQELDSALASTVVLSGARWRQNTDTAWVQDAGNRWPQNSDDQWEAG